MRQLYTSLHGVGNGMFCRSHWSGSRHIILQYSSASATSAIAFKSCGCLAQAFVPRQIEYPCRTELVQLRFTVFYPCDSRNSSLRRKLWRKQHRHTRWEENLGRNRAYYSKSGNSKRHILFYEGGWRTTPFHYCSRSTIAAPWRRHATRAESWSSQRQMVTIGSELHYAPTETVHADGPPKCNRYHGEDRYENSLTPTLYSPSWWDA